MPTVSELESPIDSAPAVLSATPADVGSAEAAQPATDVVSGEFVHLAREVARFASEQPGRGWLAVLPTLAITVALQISLLLSPPWWLAIALACTLSVFLVRVFIFVHDIEHRALFRHSRLGRWLLLPFSIYYIYPPSVWRDRHQDHHRRNCQLDNDDIDGQVPLYSTTEWEQRGGLVRFAYRAVRSWTGMILGWIPFFILPVAMAAGKRPWALLWPIAQVGAVIACGMLLGWATAWWALILPIWIATILGTILFFVQHNAPGLDFRMPGDWKYGHAALRSSTYLDLPRWQHWLLGNIGYHHIHHINDRIPFYRLPEVMAAVPALQQPVQVKLSLSAINRCLRLQLWDPDLGRLISIREYNRNQAAIAAPATQPNSRAPDLSQAEPLS
ncbi:MAG: hypothetical protein EA402_12580 [Planctomycetota bacterium]|nr:MAG: hypothetical protein EA402_12580 [Planctomycetota bacterium]